MDSFIGMTPAWSYVHVELNTNGDWLADYLQSIECAQFREKWCGSEHDMDSEFEGMFTTVQYSYMYKWW